MAFSGVTSTAASSTVLAYWYPEGNWLNDGRSWACWKVSRDGDIDIH
jgi:hypothetical protein